MIEMFLWSNRLNLSKVLNCRNVPETFPVLRFGVNDGGKVNSEVLSLLSCLHGRHCPPNILLEVVERTIKLVGQLVSGCLGVHCVSSLIWVPSS